MADKRVIKCSVVKLSDNSCVKYEPLFWKVFDIEYIPSNGTCDRQNRMKCEKSVSSRDIKANIYS